MNTPTQSERLISSRDEIIRLIRQTPQIQLCVTIYDRRGGGQGHMWPSARQAMALVDRGELDGFAGRLLDENLLILNGEFSYVLKDQHQTERYRAMVANAKRKGWSVHPDVTAWLAKHDKQQPAA